MKKGQTILYIIPFLIVAVMTISLMILLPSGIEESRNECRVDCGEKGFNYTRYSSGGFAGAECWCFDVPNNRSMRIW